MFLQNVRSSIYLLIIVFCLALLFIFLLPKPAHALCASQPEDGSWRNIDPNTRSITQVQLRFICQDQIQNGKVYPPGPPWYVHLWGKCHPTDCDWNEVGARKIAGGYVYAVYEQGFATRYVYARMSQLYPGKLWLYIQTDFIDPNRADYTSQDWFDRQ